MMSRHNQIENYVPNIRSTTSHDVQVPCFVVTICIPKALRRRFRAPLFKGDHDADQRRRRAAAARSGLTVSATGSTRSTPDARRHRRRNTGVSCCRCNIRGGDASSINIGAYLVSDGRWKGEIVNRDTR